MLGIHSTWFYDVSSKGLGQLEHGLGLCTPYTFFVCSTYYLWLSLADVSHFGISDILRLPM
jgi:hypothetical protein